MCSVLAPRVRRVISEACRGSDGNRLKTVVSSEGTAPKAALEHYTVAGKTGTAQSPAVRGLPPGQVLRLVHRVLPADRPEVCISVMMDEPSKDTTEDRLPPQCLSRSLTRWPIT